MHLPSYTHIESEQKEFGSEKNSLHVHYDTEK